VSDAQTDIVSKAVSDNVDEGKHSKDEPGQYAGGENLTWPDPSSLERMILQITWFTWKDPT